MQKLGLTSKPFDLIYEGKPITFQPPPMEVHKIRPAFRVGREGRQIQQVVISLSQTIRITKDGENIKFRGGCTIILSLSNLNKMEFALVKNIRSQRRFDYQLKFQQSGGDDSLGLTTYDTSSSDNDNDLSFKHLHFHN